ncbi:Rv1678 family membrane protein [Rhodoglobus sp.]
MSEHRNHMATIVLGAVAIVSLIFVVAAPLGAPFNLIHVRGGSVAVLAVLGIIAILGGVLKRPVLGLIAGAAFGLAAVVQLFQLGQSINFLAGDASTVALFGGLGLGLVSIWLANRSSSTL